MNNQDYAIIEPNYVEWLGEKDPGDFLLDPESDPILYSTAWNSEDEIDSSDDELTALQEAQKSMAEITQDYQIDLLMDQSVDKKTSSLDESNDKKQVSGQSSMCSLPSASIDHHHGPDFIYKTCDAITATWLQSNFELKSGSSIARSDMYRAYIIFCHKTGAVKCNQALFGKCVKAVFPCLSSRRLGVRGKSRYHYNGIKPKPDSDVMHLMNVSVKSGLSFAQARTKAVLKTETENEQLSADSTSGADSDMDRLDPLTFLLPHFPTIHTVCVPAQLTEQTGALLMMYRYFAVDMLDCVTTAQFTKIREVLLKFWRTLPYDLRAILIQPAVSNIVLTCDRQIYRAITNLLVPSVLQPSQPSVLETIRELMEENFPSWLDETVEFWPEPLKKWKYKDGHTFCRNICRRLEICQMVTSADVVLSSSQTVTSLQKDWIRLNVSYIVQQCVLVCGQRTNWEQLANTVRNGIFEFHQLLLEPNTVERYLTWIKQFVMQSVKKLLKDGECKSRQAAAGMVLLQFNYIAGIVCRELTCLHSSTAFGTFHLLDVLLHDYSWLVLDDWLHNTDM